MKRIFITIIMIVALAMQGYTQKFIDVYQNGKVSGSLLSIDIDSITISGADESSRRVNFWRSGSQANSFPVASVDSIVVFHSDDEPLVYLGIVGFNQALYPKPIDILANSTSSLYNSFVGNLTRKDGTLLYYGVEEALDMLTKYKFSTPLSSVNLVTFTDGLDQGSLMMTTKYQDDSEYLSDLSSRIASTRVRGLPLTAYCLGLRGNDVTNYAQFQENLRQLATSEEKAIEVSSMSAVQNRLNEIADQIINISNRQTISMKIPGQSNGTKIRFTFDGSSAEYSSMYIEGTFNLADRSLRDVTYHGLRSTSGSTVMGLQDGIFVTYTFCGLQRTDGNGLIPVNNIRQYNMAKGSTQWQVNSEFTPGNNTQTTVTHSGAAIMLVLDCSSSLGSQFSNMQSYAKDFISRVANNAANFNVNAPTKVTGVLDLLNDNLVVNVSWDAVKYAEYYSVYRSKSSNSGFTKIADSVSVTNWRDETPLSGNNYYRVYAIGHGLTSPASTTSDVVKCELAAPNNVKASLDDKEMIVNVSWDAVKYAEYYSVYRSKSSNSGFTKVADSVSVTNWRDETPLSGNNYYRVYAIGHGLTSPTSTTSDVVKCELAAPINVNASLDDKEMVVNVSWDAVKYAECYSVYRSSSSSSGFTKVADNVPVTNWRDEAPLSGNNYYRVYAMGHGFTSNASISSEVVKCELAAPINVKASLDDKEMVVEVSWDAVKYAEYYSVYRSNYSSSGFTKVVDSLTVVNWRDEAPLSGNNYYRVYAMSHGLTSNASVTSEVVKCELAAPTNVIGESELLADNKWVVNVSWDAVKYAEYYSVYRSKSSSSGFTKVADNVPVTNWRDESPLSGSNYYRIYAMGHGLTSPASTTSDVVKCELAAPNNVIASLDDKEMIVNVSWEAVKYSECYSVYRSGSSNSGFTKVADNLVVTSWRDETPLSGYNYYRIYAMGHGLTSNASTTSDVVKCELAAPTNVIGVAEFLTDNKWAVNVSWDAVKYAEYYSVYRSKSSSSGFTKVADNVPVTNWRDESPLSGSNYYRISAMAHGLTSDASQTSNDVKKPLCPDDHHPHMIDLGLPSGTKWACCNVGANTPEGYGGYYAWGETEEKDYYDGYTYKYYQNEKSVNLGKDIADTEYDVANVKWGDLWVMPSVEQIDELLKYCTNEWYTENGVDGVRFTSKIKGVCIFLPAAGYRYDSDLYYAGSYGGYWSSTQDPSYSSNAYNLYFNSGYKGWGSNYRAYGLSVRPVSR